MATTDKWKEKYGELLGQVNTAVENTACKDLTDLVEKSSDKAFANIFKERQAIRNEVIQLTTLLEQLNKAKAIILDANGK